MKFTLFTVFALAASAIAAPVVKRATTSDAAPYGYATLNGGTTGGSGGRTVTVNTLAELKTAASASGASIIIIGSSITGAESVKVASNKTIVGKSSSITLNGVGLIVKSASNVIIRNLKIQKVLASSGDAIAINKGTNVWIDHVDVSSDRDHDKDYYDGLLDFTHAADYVTVSNSYIHDHWKASLIGHSDSNSAEDTGHLRVTFANNYFQNLNSRGPSYRFGTGHIYNNYYDTVSDGINTRDGAQLLVENNVFSGSKKPLYSTDKGYAVATGNDFGGESNTALAGTLTKAPYTYTKIDAAKVKAAVVGTAGATLSF
ncbi:putative pectate lyase A [Pyronema domesticum]|uniref:pectate lyase n=1 Tax=Pyronema omphalodes (strain CBS 100304) TaxID=1076935 RepID=U4LA16_PYROM|nr:putative pectate lyase A [Pyronema domesticum]CCX16227.1 Similar to Probable pectate lyase A; acc. no. A1CYB8 [Pyronema omphalodes CBS 100304]